MTRERPLALALLLSAVACARAEAAPSAGESPEAVAVTTTLVTEQSFAKTTLLSGSLLANQRAEIAADTAGKVLKTYVERGDVVAKGALLARLDSRENAMHAAEASAAAEAALTQEQHQKLECQRSEKLLAQKVISRAEHDRQRASCDSSAAATRAAKARAARAGKEVGDSSIRAPFAGIVVERSVAAGELVVPGRRIAVLVQRDPLRVELAVPEAAVTKIGKGQAVWFSVAPLPAERFRAEVRYVGPVLDQKSRNLIVEALVESDDARLLPGMFATARLPVGEQRWASIPATAVTGRSESPRVFVVQNGKLQERLVQLGERDGDRVAVLKGLARGERIVAAPVPGLADGTRVE
ncbi:MAG: efflux RND transporter periplasmic adaptor subunit [Myxococcales bacterium]|nr:efflux RND transporter periplasmic adaptor subunit [Myxococcales bacterium]